MANTRPLPSLILKLFFHLAIHLAIHQCRATWENARQYRNAFRPSIRLLRPTHLPSFRPWITGSEFLAWGAGAVPVFRLGRLRQDSPT